MLKISQIKEWVKGNQTDIVLIVGVIFIAFISFGLGRLTAPLTVKNPIIIEQPSGAQSTATTTEQGTANTAASTSASSLSAPSASTQTSAEQQKRQFITSKAGTKYHWPWCSYAKNIKPENAVWFKTEAEAQAAGYTACGCISRSAPVGYKK